MSDIEKIINDAWEIKDQINKDSDKSITDAVKHILKDLDQGKIRQVGTPMEIYNQPANIFVASFIGSPSMNLIPCELSANGNTIFAQLIGRLKISIPQESISRNASNREVWLGIHPENLVVYKNETVGTLAVEVHNFEELGATSTRTMEGLGCSNESMISNAERKEMYRGDGSYKMNPK